MQIATGGMFSRLNNLKVNNIVSTDMDEAFGFTPAEVERLCADMGHPERFEEAREWYDGYRFGESDIYNPWSVLNYVDSGFRPEAYWAGTSGNTIIDDLLSIPDESTYGNMMTLGSGGSIESDLTTGMTFADINDLGRRIYSVLAFSGYLTAAYDADSMSYRLRIPNRKMYGVFSERILDRLEGMMSGRMRRLSTSLLGNDTDGITSSLTDLFEHVVSGRVLDDEHSYQAFIAGMLMNLFGNYRITADFESGSGYHDIRMERVRGNCPNVVIEIKRMRDGDVGSLESLADAALRQIRERDYAHGLRGTTTLYGMAFRGKTPAVASEIIKRC